MFGLLGLLGFGAIKATGAAVYAYRDAETRRKTDNGTFYLKASKGGAFSSQTGHPCYPEFVSVYCNGEWKYPWDQIDGAQKGDYVLRDMVTKRIIKNYTKEKRDARNM